MSEIWTTKYGRRRVRHDPPGLAEALAAAQGLTDNAEEQAELAASLMGVPVTDVEAEMRKLASVRRPVTVTAVGRKGMSRAVIVERRPSRAIGAARVSRPQ